MGGTEFTTYLCGGMLIALMIFLVSGFRIVPEYRRIAVYRLGHFIGQKGPGVVYLIPIVDRGHSIDLRDKASKMQPYQHTVLGKNGEPKTVVDAGGKYIKHGNGFQKNLDEVFKRIKTFMNPDYDLGIKNMRFRGLVRIMMGIFLTTVFVFLTIGGASIYDKLDVPKHEEGEENWSFILLIGLPGLSAFFVSMHVLWGVVELLMKKSWNQISSSIRLLLLFFVGVPLGILLIASIIYLASKIM